MKTFTPRANIGSNFRLVHNAGAMSGKQKPWGLREILSEKKAKNDRAKAFEAATTRQLGKVKPNVHVAFTTRKKGIVHVVGIGTFAAKTVAQIVTRVKRANAGRKTLKPFTHIKMGKTLKAI